MSVITKWMYVERLGLWLKNGYGLKMKLQIYASKNESELKNCERDFLVISKCCL